LISALDGANLSLKVGEIYNISVTFCHSVYQNVEEISKINSKKRMSTMPLLNAL